MHSAWKHLLLITLISSVVMLTGLGGARLWDRDEPRNAGCAREMLERLDWIVPTFNGELRAHKPVLLYWCIMAAYSLGGVNEFTARLPSAVCAIGSALATYAMGRRLFSPAVGLWSGIILSTSLMFGVAGRAATPDSLLIFCITLAMMVFVLSVFRPAGEKQESDPNRYFPQRLWQAALLYGVIGLAVLAKGPVGLVLPTAVIGMFLLIKRLPETAPGADARKEGTSLRLRCRLVFSKLLRPFAPLHFLRTCLAMRPLLAIGMVLLVAAPWYLAVGIKTDGAFLREFFVTHNIDRATSSMEGHRGGPWYYPVAMLLGFFPWSIFAVPLVLETAIRLRRGDKNRDGYLLATCWVCVWVGVFSIAKTKLPSYVTPCYPALALLAGCFVQHLRQGTLSTHRYWLAVSFGCLAAAGVAIAVGIPLAAARFLPGEEWLGILGAPVLACGIAASFLYQANRAGIAIPITALAGGVTILGVLTLGAQRADLHRRDGEMVIEYAQTSPHIAAAGVLDPSWVFYSGRPILELRQAPASNGKKEITPAQAAAALLASDPETLLITRRDLAQAVERELPGIVIMAESPRFLKPELTERLVILRGPKGVETARRARGDKISH